MLLLGMMIGATGGVGFGVVLMCCLIAGKREDMLLEEQMQEAFLKERKKRKCIRFLNAQGKEIFRIFDGETITLTSGDGSSYVSVTMWIRSISRWTEYSGRFWRLPDGCRKSESLIHHSHRQKEGGR